LVIVVVSLLLFFINSNFVFGQTAPVNFGFESGTFNGWTGATGQCCPMYMPNTGIDTSRHLITSGNYTDPYSNGLISVVAPSSLFSARLGNDNNSAESEALDYAFVVPSDSLLLKIHFAVLLENGLHPTVKQPRFSYTVTSGNLPLEGCTSVSVIAGEGTPDYIFNGDIELYQWQTRIVSLINRQGQNITIHFETGDCGPGGHFGYAYVDCELLTASINAVGCNADGSLNLIAPSGIDGIWHTGSTNDTLHIANPDANAEYFYEINSGLDCTFKLYKSVNHLIPSAVFVPVGNCAGEFYFDNISIAQTGSVSTWNFGDSATANGWNELHQYQQPGNYTISLLVSAPNYCRSEYIDSVQFLPVPHMEFSNLLNCETTPVQFESNLTQGMNSSWAIDNIILYTGNTATHLFSNPGTHLITLTVDDGNGCSLQDSETIEIIPREVCDDNLFPFLPNAFSPNGDGVNEFFSPVSFTSFDEIIMTIYNRFGQVIYEGKVWNGYSRNGMSPQGVYCYTLSCKSGNISRQKTGLVSLVR